MFSPARKRTPRELLQQRKSGKKGARTVSAGAKTGSATSSKIATSTPESEELLARAEARVRADGLAAAPAEDLLDLIEQMNEQIACGGGEPGSLSWRRVCVMSLPI